ncbi:peptidoglycan editing factor PgeF [Legionella feeleii]|uniref:Purine nucleoside phosphorylase n=1 Tax=Legionella feeleii TaxID=453 RepID=A0A0W0U792_9GAMM|nr:peptidoglycan editing factor PgeF [Legionella feeleii]KTD03669.1 Laccase domain protein YfiH [Legionella feeleii]SPX59250.1 Laccase domain protein yfiH [Legionella feeleii]
MTFKHDQKNDNTLEALHEPTLKQLSSIKHAFFTRRGGVSEGRYSSLNCAYGSDDEPGRVEENRRRITTFLGYPLTSLVTVKNVHGNKAVIVNEHWPENETIEADAMVTKQKNILLGSDSADCPIVLFADEQAGVIGLAHAGWRGAKAGVLQSTIHKMEELGASPKRVVAAISPCIAQASYEVSHDFYEAFIQDNQDNLRYFKSAEKLNHFLFDLPGFVERCLVNLHLKSIGQMGIDTYTDKRFFSCRRAYHAGEDDFGGNFSCILLK